MVFRDAQKRGPVMAPKMWRCTGNDAEGDQELHGNVEKLPSCSGCAASALSCIVGILNPFSGQTYSSGVECEVP